MSSFQRRPIVDRDMNLNIPSLHRGKKPSIVIFDKQDVGFCKNIRTIARKENTQAYICYNKSDLWCYLRDNRDSVKAVVIEDSMLADVLSSSSQVDNFGSLPVVITNYKSKLSVALKNLPIENARFVSKKFGASAVYQAADNMARKCIMKSKGRLRAAQTRVAGPTAKRGVLVEPINLEAYKRHQLPRLPH